MNEFAVDGVGTVNMVRAGPRGGTPILLLHGVGLDLTWWGDQFAALARHDVIAVDMPGHGLSDRLGGKPTFERLTSVSEQVLDAVGCGPAQVVGVSVGGMLAQHLALRRPDLVMALTLVSTLCTFPENVRQALKDRARVARSQGMARIAELSNERWFPAAFRERRPDVLDAQPARAGRRVSCFDLGDDRRLGARRRPSPHPLPDAGRRRRRGRQCTH